MILCSLRGTSTEKKMCWLLNNERHGLTMHGPLRARISPSSNWSSTLVHLILIHCDLDFQVFYFFFSLFLLGFISIFLPVFHDSIDNLSKTFHLLFDCPPGDDRINIASDINRNLHSPRQNLGCSCRIFYATGRCI